MSKLNQEKYLELKFKKYYDHNTICLTLFQLDYEYIIKILNTILYKKIYN